MLAIWSASIVLWRRAGGFFGIRDTGESASIFLSQPPRQGHRILLLAGARGKLGSGGAGLLLYSPSEFHFAAFLHDRHRAGHVAGDAHPRLPHAFGAFASAGLSRTPQPLRSRLSRSRPSDSSATSYGVYFAQAGDLLRGPHAVMLWLLVYLMALEWDAPSERPLGRNIALAVLFVFIASSDWAFFLFCSSSMRCGALYAAAGSMRGIFSLGSSLPSGADLPRAISPSSSPTPASSSS